MIGSRAEQFKSVIAYNSDLNDLSKVDYIQNQTNPAWVILIPRRKLWIEHEDSITFSFYVSLDDYFTFSSYPRDGSCSWRSGEGNGARESTADCIQYLLES